MVAVRNMKNAKNVLNTENQVRNDKKLKLLFKKNVLIGRKSR